MPSTHEDERQAWPDQARQALRGCSAVNHHLLAILHQRLNEKRLAECNLLAALSNQSVKSTDRSITLELLCGLQLQRGQPLIGMRVLEASEALIDERFEPKQQNLISLRRRQLAMVLGESHDSKIQTPQQIGSVLGQIQQFQEDLLEGNQDAVESILSNWPPEWESPEAFELKSQALKSLGRYKEAMAALNELLGRGAIASATAWKAVLEMNYLEGRSNGLALSTATRIHPHDPGIACHRVFIHLSDRQPALARRSAYKERILYTLGKACPSHLQSDANLLAAYDHTGRTELSAYLHHSIIKRLANTPAAHANLVMQLGSFASPLYAERAEALGLSFSERKAIKRRSCSQPLKVGLIGPDFSYHPVGRFIQMFLEAGLGQTGELHIINTGKAAMPQLQELVENRIHHIQSAPLNQQREKILRLELDVAVDLAGWTGDHNGILFAKGIAPVQINYLGYFASSGLPAMDVWLGDRILFPEPMQEWHSEQIVRLPRPFLAWQPNTSLPEGRVSVPPAPNGPITIGCFNHVRKLSAATLSLWAQILQAIPGSRLALKAFTSDDPGVVALLEKRMRHCGLDPSSVEWIPTSPKPEDHLRQYGLIDVALDPFPNGGCTTTCEALWMGVPVITLLGSKYVSRMAAAVLHGGQLTEWIAISQEEYLQLACRAADQLNAIRRGRTALRAHLQASPLGDAADLAQHLWMCFEALI